MSFWQPIATAPKDGTRILAFCESMEQWTVVRWSATGGEPFDGPPAWAEDSQGPGYSSDWQDQELTAWMPLPLPPQEGKP